MTTISMKHKIFGTLILFSATVLWGSAYVARKMAFEDIGPIMQNSARFLAGFCFMLLATIVHFRRKKKVPDDAGVSRAGKPLSLQIRQGMIIGLVFSVASAMQQIGLMMVDAGKAGFISVLYTVMVPVIAFVLYRTRIRKQVWIGMALSFAGLFLITGGVSGFEPGYVFLLAGSFFFAMQIILIDQYIDGAEPMVLVTTQLAAGVVVNLIIAAIVQEPFTWSMLYDARWSILYTGVLSLGVANVFQFVGQKLLEPSVTAIICSFESVFSLLFGMLILGEQMTPLQFLGSFFLFMAVIISQLEKKENTGET